MTDQIRLESVGAFIQTDGIVLPMLANNLPDLTEEGNRIDDCCEEWHNSLSKEDKSTVAHISADLGLRLTLPSDRRWAEYQQSRNGEKKDYASRLQKYVKEKDIPRTTTNGSGNAPAVLRHGLTRKANPCTNGNYIKWKTKKRYSFMNSDSQDNPYDGKEISDLG